MDLGRPTSDGSLSDLETTLAPSAGIHRLIATREQDVAAAGIAPPIAGTPGAPCTHTQTMGNERGLPIRIPAGAKGIWAERGR